MSEFNGVQKKDSLSCAKDSICEIAIPLSLIKVIEKAIEKAPNKRWKSAEEMREALTNAVK